MDVVVDRNVLGSQKNLIISNDGFTWTENLCDDVWWFSGKIKIDSLKCWDTILRLNGLFMDVPRPPKSYLKMMEMLVGNSTFIPWSMIIPQDRYKEFFKSVIDYVRDQPTLTTEYYESAWLSGNHVLNSLKPAKVDGVMINDIVNSSMINSHVVETFRPRAGGYAQQVIYDRFATVTGRLVVKSGPNILLLKKDYRSLLKPSVSGGRIMSIDFASLEARILLYESGNDCKESDMYSMLASRFGGLPRDLVKAVVLSVLYGSSKSMVALNLGVSESKVVDVINQIERFIDTKALLKRLKSQYSDLGYIKNKHGRRIEIDRVQDNILINYYAQSTGVDIALIGFSKIIDKLRGNGIRPLFVLHDALIIDVHPDRIDDVTSISKIKVPGYDQEFYLKIEDISKC